MKVLHVVPYLPVSSGVTTFVAECSDVLQSRGVDQVIAVKDTVHFEVAPSKANVPRICFSEALAKLDTFDIVHMHGIWPPFFHRFVALAKRKHIPIVWSAHGMLSPWAMRYHWWKKCLPWVLWQKNDLTKASVLHITSALEGEWVRARGLTGPTTVIPLGTHVPEKLAERNHPLKVLLYVGRINPIKALDNLILAWHLSQPQGWILRIVGDDQRGCMSGLIKLAHEHGVRHTVEFPGPKYGADLEKEYQGADALVLPSHTENFGAVVIDALARGLPVIASTGTPWQELVSRKCGWWVKNSPDQMAQAISEATKTLNEKEKERALAKNGHDWMTEEYSWKAISAKLLKAYDQVRQ